VLKWFIRRRLEAFERRYDYDMTYARELLATDTRAFLAFARATALGGYRRDLPADVYWSAKLIGTIAEDCGPCTQLLVAMALEAGVAPGVLSAVLAGDEARMSEPVRLGVRFARATLAHSIDADPLREELVARWGDRALISISFAIVAARIYPTLKYALGHGKACVRVSVAGEQVVVARSAA